MKYNSSFTQILPQKKIAQDLPEITTDNTKERKRIPVHLPFPFIT